MRTNRIPEFRHLARSSRVATVRVGSTAIRDAMESLGLDFVEVLAELRIDRALFDDLDNMVSLVDLDRLLEHCALRSRCEHFGLLVGQRSGLDTLGLVGLAAMHAPDVASALRTITTHIRLHNSAAQLQVSADDRYATLSYDMHAPDFAASNQLRDGALAGLCNVLRTLCGPRWQPTVVCLAHRSPVDVQAYRKVFRAPLRWNSEQSAIVLPVEWLERTLPASNHALTRLLGAQLEALEARCPDSLASQVRLVLRSVLLSANAGEEHVARLFSMHSRTLRRRLADSGTTFKALADEGRCALSRELLANTSLEISEIAASLDYADASAFTRAFRRWTGTTPAAWRAARPIAGTPLAVRSPGNSRELAVAFPRGLS